MPGHTQDVALVESILGGDGQSWNAFVERFSEPVWRRSWQLCNEACIHKHARGRVACVFHSLAAGGVPPASDPRPGCDEGLELYAYIFDYLYNRHQHTGKLKAYDGRSRLETFVAAVLRGHLRTDWIRHRRQLRLDQITYPPEIERLARKDQRVYEQMLMQRPTETIAREVGLSTEEAAQAQERVTHALMANGNLHLVLRNPEQGLGEFERAGDDLAQRVLPLRRATDRLWETVCDLIAALPEEQKVLLDLVFMENLDAGAVLERCDALGLTLPVTPRDGVYTIHSVYQSVDLIMKALGQQLQEQHPDVVREGLHWLDDVPDDAARSISHKGLKALLKSMGLRPTGPTPTAITP